MAEERTLEQNQFLVRKLYNDKKHITIKDMMAYIDSYCPENREWFKGLLLETTTIGEGKDKKTEVKNKTLKLKQEFYKKCVPEKEKEKKKSRREKLIDEMGW